MNRSVRFARARNYAQGLAEFGGGGTGYSDDTISRDARGIPHRALDIDVRYDVHIASLDVTVRVTNRCAEPVALPKGTKMHCVAHFDNSAKNPNNPDPKADVFWGDQTWEEMMVGWFDYYLDAEKP